MLECTLLEEIAAAECNETSLPCVLIQNLSRSDYSRYIDRWIEADLLPTPYVEWRSHHSEGSGNQLPSQNSHFGKLVAIEMPSLYHEVAKAEVDNSLNRALRNAGATEYEHDLISTGQLQTAAKYRIGESNGGWRPVYSDDELKALRSRGAKYPLDTMVCEVATSQSREDILGVRNLSLLLL